MVIGKAGRKWVLYSRRKRKGRRRRLGVFSTKKAALRREKQIQHFKKRKR